MRMFPRTDLLAFALLAAFGAAPSHAATYSYRGALSDRGAPAEGSYGFRLSFYATRSGGMPIASPTMLDGIAVHGGAFSAELDLDQGLVGRDSAWLEVEVRDAKGGFLPIAERTEVRPKQTAAGVCWDTQGNAGTNPTTDFLGTSDAQALSLRAGNIRALRLEPGVGSLPNVIGGASTNSVTAGASTATIGGGKFNSVTDNGGTVAGGRDNLAGDNAGTVSDAEFAAVGGGTGNVARGSRSVIGGGIANGALGEGATVPGGQFNCAGGDLSFAGGYAAKVRPAVPTTGGSCANGAVSAGPAVTGDAGTFIWNADTNSVIESTGPNQFIVRAPGGIGFNTAQVADATVSIANVLPGAPLLRVFNSAADQALGGRVLISENAVSSAGGYMRYDAFNNVFYIGTNTGSADVDTIYMTRGLGRVGIGRTAQSNTLEVEGDASKTTATAWLANSDARIKQEIEPIPHALETLSHVRPVTFRYSDAYRAAHPSIVDRRYYNVVAQEFAQVFPEAVKRSGETIPGGGDDEILQVDVHPALITTIAATQELAAQVRDLSERLARVEAENQRLQGAVDTPR